MDSIRIRGGRTLNGTIAADGAKNAALPELAAALLADGELLLDNVPMVQDVRTMLRVLEHLGVAGRLEPSGNVNGCQASTRPVDASVHEVPYDIVKTMRA